MIVPASRDVCRIRKNRGRLGLKNGGKSVVRYIAKKRGMPYHLFWDGLWDSTVSVAVRFVVHARRKNSF